MCYRYMLVNWEKHKIRLEGIKVADEGKRLFKTTEFEMAALLPFCLINECPEFSRSTWSTATEQEESDLWCHRIIRS